MAYCTVHPLRCLACLDIPLFLKAQLRSKIPYFVLDNEQDAMCKLLLIKQETDWIDLLWNLDKAQGTGKLYPL